MIKEFKIKLRDFKKEDVKKTFEFVLDDELRKFFMMRGIPEWKTHVDYFEKKLKDKTQKIYAICLDELHIGNCGLINLTEYDAEIWIYLGNKNLKGLGYGKLATKTLVNKAFRELNLKKLYLHVAKFNSVAQTIYTKLGFQEKPMDSSDIWYERKNEVIKMELSFTKDITF